MKKKLIVFFLFIFLLPSVGYTDQSVICENKLDQKKIKNISVKIDDYRKWTVNSTRILIGNFRWIPKKYKRRFNADVIVNFENNLKCSYRARVRNSGNQKDHIALKGNSIIQSIDVHLVNGHINGISKFKLLRSNTRGNFKDEILLTELLREFNYLSPRTHFIDVKTNNLEAKMLFQEKPDTALLKFNNRKNGPIFEGDERFMFRLAKELPDNNLSNLSLGMLPLLEKGVNTMLARQINSEWNQENLNNLNIAHNSLTKLNTSYLLYINKYKSEKNNFDYSKYSLNNNLLGLNNKKNILKLDVYNLIVFASNGSHGLTPNNRKFYWNSLENFFEPINSDTNANIDLETNILHMPYSYQIESAFIILNKLLNKLDVKKLNNNMSFRGIELSEIEIKQKINKIKINLNNLKKIYLEADQDLVRYNRSNVIEEKMWNNYFQALYDINPNIYVVKKSEKNGSYKRCKIKPFVCYDFNLDKNQINDLVEGRLVIKDEEYQYLGVM